MIADVTTLTFFVGIVRGFRQRGFAKYITGSIRGVSDIWYRAYRRNIWEIPQMIDYSDITLVITSCKRFELLERTIASMRPWISKFPASYIVEDSQEFPAILRHLEEVDGFTVLRNMTTLGQHRSIDRAYANITTKYIFHCEDDWLFHREPNFDSAMYLLDNGIEEHKKISLVCFRDFTTNTKHKQNSYNEFDLSSDEEHEGRYKFSFDPGSRYNSFTFNPSILRRDLLQITGPYGDFLTEGSIARYLRKRGYIILTEIPGIAEHIGDELHIPRKSPRWHERILQWIKKGV